MHFINRRKVYHKDASYEENFELGILTWKNGGFFSK